ncbi:alpha/beta fold hydrolase [Streptomyces sp. NPDC097619]|uniref:thioesterase II family protein n=1 Tax=Streptomyces sp. NPDC097619 TaxID=3157228 RepID=UPI00332A8B05
MPTGYPLDDHLGEPMTAAPLLPLRPRTTPAARRLVCFPHAGGSAGWYRPWGAHLDDSVELLGVQYPGREHRFGEPLVADMATLVTEITAALRAEPQRPTVFFGHSMGASVAYETLLRLEAAGSRQVTRLVVSGRRAVVPPATAPARPMTDAELVESMTTLGGTPRAVLADPELRALFLPPLRNDYLLLDRYRPAPGTPPIHADLIAVTGDADPRVTVDEMRAWTTLTTGRTATRVFPGGHFYLADHAAPLAHLATSPELD